jgi:hypothetical protein
MKTSETFKNVIQKHLQEIAKTDELFAKTLQKPNKNIDDCTTYILNEVQKSGMNGFADEEIFNMAIHYYDEDEIEVGKTISAKVIVNHHVEITPEERAEAKQKAIDQAIREQKEKLTKKSAPIKKQTAGTEFTQQSLF